MKTEIVFLLDRTGSMRTIKSDVVGGYNEFVEQQKKTEGEADLTLIQFDAVNPHEIVYRKPIGEVPEMQMDDFQPRATTPLHDAMGRAIDATGEYLKNLQEEQRPDLVVFVVFTDGLENDSQEYTGERVAEMVKHQTETYSWQFIFLGAGIDAIKAGGQMGLQRAGTVSVGTQNAGAAIRSASNKVASYRGTGDAAALNYTDEERQALS